MTRREDALTHGAAQSATNQAPTSTSFSGSELDPAVEEFRRRVYGRLDVAPYDPKDGGEVTPDWMRAEMGLPESWDEPFDEWARRYINVEPEPRRLSWLSRFWRWVAGRMGW